MPSQLSRSLIHWNWLTYRNWCTWATIYIYIYQYIIYIHMYIYMHIYVYIYVHIYTHYVSRHKWSTRHRVQKSLAETRWTWYTCNHQNIVPFRLSPQGLYHVSCYILLTDQVSLFDCLWFFRYWVKCAL